MASERIGVYPGTFDPITNGHMDIIQRAATVMDRLVVGVAVNAGKGPLFGVEERVRMVRDEVAALNSGDGERIGVAAFDNLLMDFAVEQGACMIVRGLRAVSDFDYEFQMASMNAKLNAGVETVCLMASDKHQFIASRLVKEIAMLGGDISAFVSPRVADLLVERCAGR
ncbi:MAG: pantetheine-phosphate adenylyltransferase [Defluviicoccus sp.]|nr:pantetheine-phosphate adenylyltransferase [Defluviicoccus sp.]MDE0278400.1 pantetheine-phosphate adenylyltransferase [Defluviicoccus sp.]